MIKGFDQCLGAQTVNALVSCLRSITMQSAHVALVSTRSSVIPKSRRARRALVYALRMESAASNNYFANRVLHSLSRNPTRMQYESTAASGKAAAAVTHCLRATHAGCTIRPVFVT